MEQSELTARVFRLLNLGISLALLAYILRVWYDQDPAFAAQVDKVLGWAKYQGASFRYRTRKLPGWLQELREVRGLD